MDYKNKMQEKKIREEEIIEAIKKSGYLIEQRIFNKLVLNNHIVTSNPIFVDQITSKKRELDIRAQSQVEFDIPDWICYDLICECENNHQPVVFFKQDFNSKSYYKSIKYSGLCDFLDQILGKTEIEEAFFEGNLSTQYCSFKQTKKNNIDKWIALHPQEQHDTFDKLVKAIKYRKDEILKPTLSRDAFLLALIHYPVIILGGDMYEIVEDKELELYKSNHIKYRIADLNELTGKRENCYVDVITEDYLEKYLDYVSKEFNLLKNMIHENRLTLIEQVNNYQIERLESL